MRLGSLDDSFPCSYKQQSTSCRMCWRSQSGGARGRGKRRSAMTDVVAMSGCRKRRKNETTTSELRIIYVHRWVGEMEHSAKNKFQCVCFRRVMRISIKLCMLRQLFPTSSKTKETRSENEPRLKQLNLVL